MSRHRLPVVLISFLAAAGCRHHQQHLAPAAAPPAAENTPVVHVAPNDDFVPAKPAADDLSDVSKATAIADQKGWLRDAFFAFNSSLLGTDSRENLEDSATWLKAHPSFDVVIEGHCDERGTEQYNLALGQRRAWEAKSYLAIVGFDPDRVKTISYGKERPFDPGHNEEAWAKNRRAHLVLTASR